MTVTQICFLVIWLLLLIMATWLIVKTKKYDTFQKVMLLIMIILVPILGALIIVGMLRESLGVYWSNSATKDNMWLAQSDINDSSGGGGDSGTSGD